MLRFEVYILIVLKDSRLSKAIKRATTVCAAKVFHRKYKRILWPFILAVSLEMFYDILIPRAITFLVNKTITKVS